MPRSQLISAAALRRLVVYAAAAFVLVLLVGMLVPAGSVRRGLLVGWMVAFPLGAWWVIRKESS